MGRGEKEAGKNYSKITTIRFLPKAEWDVILAAEWYSVRDPQLAEDFYSILDDSLELICEHPEAFPYYSRPVRKKNMYRFPYSIFYFIEGDQLIIQGVLHFERDNWKIIESRSSS
jgi:toxin ParE1/3/4